jgi:xanthine dehydrogenase accessory factor
VRDGADRHYHKGSSNMSDIVTLLAATDRLHAAGEEGVLVTLVNAKGSTYRRPGARMLVLPGCRTVGTISGGCLDSAPEDDTWGPASGCHGLLYLLAEKLEPGERSDVLEQCRLVGASQRPSVHIHLLRLSAEGTLAANQSKRNDVDTMNRQSKREAAICLANAASRWVEWEGDAAFLEYLAPPTHLVVCGAGDDAQPLVTLATEMAWTVKVVDSRARLATRQRFPTANAVTSVDPATLASHLHPHSVVVLMTHRFADDLELLNGLFRSELSTSYIGILGPRQRTDRLLAELAARGVVPSIPHLRALRSPIGLDVGASAPETIALSIVAEIQAHLTARDARPLSMRSGSILPPIRRIESLAT